jgi:hypothetical protein
MQSDQLVVERYTSAARFLEEVGPLLAASEAENNLVLGLVHLLNSTDHPFHEPIYLAAVKRGAQVVGCAVRPPPDHIDLTAMPVGAAELVAASAALACPDLFSVGGPLGTAREFARAWVQRLGGRWQVIYRLSWFALHRVEPPPAAPGGRLRLAEAADWPLICEWEPRYVRDTGGRGTVLPFLERRMRTGSLYVWDHDGPKCMVSISGHTPNGVRVSGVYTPDEHRKRGYASNTVAVITQQALDSGRKFCVLSANSGDTATLRVYQNIGYRPVRDTVVIELAR